MLIPSIDLMGGKIVQLVQGERKALEFDDFDWWIERFVNYPLIQLIDLDAAMGQGDNRRLLAYFADRLPCQVGGGIRTVQIAESMLAIGARKVIVGSSLIQRGEIDTDFAARLVSAIGRESLVCAIDSRGGKVAVHGWRASTEFSPIYMMEVLEPWCDAFLYTHIDTEGLMQGFPLQVIRELRAATKRRLIAAGGIASHEEIAVLDSLNVDAVVGMAIYTNRLKVTQDT
jgi:phosphoribosylformimino-5-aminoimidazole carboxamide ribotide isomerase